MVGSPVVPRILSVLGSSVSLTVMYPDWFSSGPGFEKTYGFLKMVSGHPVVRLHHPEKGRQASECQCGSTGCIKAQPVASVCIGGDGGHLGDGDGSGWVGTLRLLGMMGEGVYYSYHKQCPQFSEGVYGPTGPAPDTTKGKSVPQQCNLIPVLH